MSNDIRDVLNGEYDPLFDFNKHYNPSANDKEAAKKLEEKYKRIAADRRVNNK